MNANPKCPRCGGEITRGEPKCTHCGVFLKWKHPRPAGEADGERKKAAVPPGAMTVRLPTPPVPPTPAPAPDQVDNPLPAGTGVEEAAKASGENAQRKGERPKKWNGLAFTSRDRWILRGLALAGLLSPLTLCAMLFALSFERRAARWVALALFLPAAIGAFAAFGDRHVPGYMLGAILLFLVGGLAFLATLHCKFKTRLPVAALLAGCCSMALAPAMGAGWGVAFLFLVPGLFVTAAVLWAGLRAHPVADWQVQLRQFRQASLLRKVERDCGFMGFFAPFCDIMIGLSVVGALLLFFGRVDIGWDTVPAYKLIPEFNGSPVVFWTVLAVECLFLFTLGRSAKSLAATVRVNVRVFRGALEEPSRVRMSLRMLSVIWKILAAALLVSMFVLAFSGDAKSSAERSVWAATSIVEGIVLSVMVWAWGSTWFMQAWNEAAAALMAIRSCEPGDEGKKARLQRRLARLGEMRVLAVSLGAETHARENLEWADKDVRAAEGGADGPELELAEHCQSAEQRYREACVRAAAKTAQFHAAASLQAEKQGLCADAMAAAEEAVAADPHEPSAVRAWSRAMWRSERKTFAVAAVLFLLATGLCLGLGWMQNRAFAREMVATCLSSAKWDMEHGYWDNAKGAVARALKLDPGNESALAMQERIRDAYRANRIGEPSPMP